MRSPRDSLILALILLAAPAFAAAPRHAVKALAPVEAPVSADPAGDLMGQAQAAHARGEKELAVRLAQAAIVAAPARPATYNALGDLYAADGDADYARFYYREALNIDPTNDDATKAMAALDRDGGQRAAKADTSTQ
jgi:tetratricopeptide (TPR) repeat protein